ncbi:type VI secretion system-associated FHA domain protein TagH [Acetobacteraceae bacterium]|nr:type VI secretion system-associated FHA domain protein TagH [Acetobacteraceae bacterium]
MLILTVRQISDRNIQMRRNVNGKHVTIGRGTECEIVLKDPQKRLSKRHCELFQKTNSGKTVWVVKDTSKNGTFLNNSPIKSEEEQIFFSGDFLQIGEYEIALSIDSSDSSYPPNIIIPTPPLEEEDDPFFPKNSNLLHYQENALDPLEGFSSGNKIPSKISRGQQAPFGLDQAFTPRRTLLEENKSSTVEDHIGDDFLDSLLEDITPQKKPPENRPSPPEKSYPLERQVPPPSLHLAAEESLGLEAFLRGAELDETEVHKLSPREARETLEKMGRTFRSIIKGLRKAIIARSEIKNEFRIERTIIHNSGNNPLKFAVNDDDALWALLGIGRKTAFSPENTIAETLRDMQLHELAIMNAMIPALEEFLETYSIEAAKKTFGKNSSGDLPWWNTLSAWQKATALHKEGKKELRENTDGVFGKAFATAYEKYLQKMKNETSYADLNSEQSNIDLNASLRKNK